MIDHHPTPWTARPCGPTVNTWLVVDAVGLAVGVFPHAAGEALARRVAQCVSFCVGVSSEDLDGLPDLSELLLLMQHGRTTEI